MKRKSSRLKSSLTFLLMTHSAVQKFQNYINIVSTVDILLSPLILMGLRLVFHYEMLYGFLCSDEF